MPPSGSSQSLVESLSTAKSATESSLNPNMPAPATGVHLVGSFPHSSLERPYDVFAKANELCPGRLRRIPDGELSDMRFTYVGYVGKYFPKQLLLSSNPTSDSKLDPSFLPKLEDIGHLEYDRFAITSYAEFVAARNDGKIPSGVRFQVSIPSPIEPMGHIHPAYRADVAPLYEQRTLEALARLQDAIPAPELAVQWDCAVSIARIEMRRGRLADSVWMRPWVDDAAAHAVQVLARVGAAVKTDVELGFHLCYGDAGHKHFVEPDDLGVLVELANGLVDALDRPFQWIHVPVPKDRTDAAYFAPLGRLRLGKGTQLFLGLLHFGDREGTEERIAAAAGAWPRGFGVATECGMARTPPEQLDGLLRFGAEVAGRYSWE